MKAAPDQSSIAEISAGFKNPEAPYRALPMCSYDYAHIQQQASSARSAGWGGMNVQYPDWGEGYLQTKESWSKFAEALKACKENGLSMWIYDERGYPSGKAEALVLKDHPEFEAQGLFYDALDIGETEPRSGEWKLPPGQPYYVVLYATTGAHTPLVGKPVELTSRVANGVLKYELKPGNWRLMTFVQDRLFKGTHSEILGERYINIMDPRAVRKFIEVTHEQYFARHGDEFGKTIQAFFTDEPSLMGGYLVDETQSYPVLSWWDGMPGAYRQMRGYDVREALPALFNDVGADTIKKRCDYYSAVSRLTAGNYFGQIRKWCEAHHVASTGHCVWEESLIYHAYFYGSIFDSLAEFDWPGIDLLGCSYGDMSGSRTEGGPVTPKLISSVAHLYGKPRTATESFCFVTKQTPPADMLSVVGWQWVLGINWLTTLSMQGEHTPEVQQLLNDYTGRLSYLLTRGKFVADVAVLYPIASVWADFVPSNRPVWHMDVNPGAAKVDDAWQAVTRTLLGCQRDFDYIDEASVGKARISTGAMGVGECRYSVLVLPNVTTLEYATLVKIMRFVERGGTVVACGDIPSQRADAGSVTEFRKLSDQLWSSSAAWSSRVIWLKSHEALPKAMEAIGGADVRAITAGMDVYSHHRSVKSGDIYYLQNNGVKTVSGDVSFRATGRVQIWDPVSGTMEAAKAKSSGRYSTVSLNLPARNGLFLVFDRSRQG